MTLVFSHYSDTRNVGDLASGPYLYFRFPEHRVVDQNDEPDPECDAIVFGGGAMVERLAEVSSAAVQARTKIAWGVGSSAHGLKEPTRISARLDLCGSRDWGAREAEYAPCASCMSPLFDQDYSIQHDAVLYLNADPSVQRKHPVKVDGLPQMHNRSSLEDVVKFLASGSIVVTNSYHGAYWGQLLRRRVAVVGAYSSKFYRFKFPVPVAGFDDWKQRASSAEGSLEDARLATRKFYDKVMELVRCC